MPRPVPNAEQQQQLDVIEAIPHDIVIGIDEVGSGSLAGPLVVGGVVVRRGWDHPIVLDSKALTPKRRVEAREVVLRSCLGWCVMSIEAPHLDREGMGRALDRLTVMVGRYLSSRFDGLIVTDGMEQRIEEAVTLPKADALVPAVSAASIVAKVWRDSEMEGYSQVFPYYSWYKNKGYKSKEHTAALEAYGPCVLHRFSYSPLKKLARSIPGGMQWADRFTSDGTPAPVEYRDGFPGGA